MEARIRQAVVLAVVLSASMGAQVRTANFIIETPDPNFAQQAAQTAERCRRELAVEWTGKTMPNWSQPCVMEVKVGRNLGAGGATTFMFDRGEVFGWRMSIQGSQERILDSVLPHEITHMIYASHFRQPVPRWADEGGATSVEHSSERNKQRQMLDQFLHTGRGIAFSQMFVMSEYPADIMPLYAQGYSLAEYLIQTGGRRKYVEFIGDGLEKGDWTGAIQRHYGIQGLGVLQNIWLAWVRQGYPPLQPSGAGEMLAAADRRPRPAPNLIYHVPNSPQPVGVPAETSVATVVPAAAVVPIGNSYQAAALSPAVPLAKMVPVLALASQTPGTAVQSQPAPELAAARTRATVAATKWVSPVAAPVAQQTASAASATYASANGAAMPSAKALPAIGWHVPGAPTASAAQTAHPMPLEQPRQMAIE